MTLVTVNVHKFNVNKDYDFLLLQLQLFYLTHPTAPHVRNQEFFERVRPYRPFPSFFFSSFARLEVTLQVA